MIHLRSTFADFCILGQQNLRIFVDLWQRRPKAAGNLEVGHVYYENFRELMELKLGVSWRNKVFREALLL